MSNDTLPYDAIEARACEARLSAIAKCKADPEFVWRWRIVESAKRKGLPVKRFKHLAKWCEDEIAEVMQEADEKRREEANPYTYRGLTRDMFF